MSDSKNNSDSDTSKDENVSVNKIIKDMGKSEFKKTETDMNFQLLANEDKLKSKSDVDIFKKQDDKSESDSDSSDSDSDKNTSYHNTSLSVKSSKDELKTEDEMLQKLDMLRKLAELKKMGVKLSQNYSMESNYKAMKYEYELHKKIKSKENGIKWMSTMFMGCCYGIEMANKKFDPFSFKLDGWSKQINGDITNYYDVFGELQEKYFNKDSSVSPELKLVGLMGMSAFQFHMMRSMTNSMPDLNTQFKKDPELLKKLRQQVSDKKNMYAKRQHEEANKKISDLQMLRKQRMLYQNRINKERELQIQANKLNTLNSDSRSMYSAPYQQRTIISPPRHIRQFPQQKTIVPPQRIIRQPNSQTLKLGMASKLTRIQKLNRRENIQPRPIVNINPKLNAIVSKKLNKDTESILSVKKNSAPIKRKRGRPRKKKIQIIT